MLTLESLAELATVHGSSLKAKVREFSIAGKVFPFNARPAIMGVINLSADSWYRESVCLNTAQAVQRGRVLAAQGADLVDIGAESTLAHAALLDGWQQRSVLLPVIRELRAENIAVSVETYRPEVVRACLEAGANVINFSGSEHADEVFKMAAGHDAAVILCHIQGPNARQVGDFVATEDAIGMMEAYFLPFLETASKANLGKIILDPGLGFYYRNLQDGTARVRHQMQVFLGTFRLRKLGFPICHALPHAFEYFGSEVRSAEPFFAVLAALGKTDLFRTHEVEKIKAVLDTLSVY